MDYSIIITWIIEWISYYPYRYDGYDDSYHNNMHIFHNHIIRTTLMIIRLLITIMITTTTIRTIMMTLEGQLMVWNLDLTQTCRLWKLDGLIIRTKISGSLGATFLNHVSFPSLNEALIIEDMCFVCWQRKLDGYLSNLFWWYQVLFYRTENKSKSTWTQRSSSFICRVYHHFDLYFGSFQDTPVTRGGNFVDKEVREPVHLLVASGYHLLMTAWSNPAWKYPHSPSEWSQICVDPLLNHGFQGMSTFFVGRDDICRVQIHHLSAILPGDVEAKLFVVLEFHEENNQTRILWSLFWVVLDALTPLFSMQNYMTCKIWDVEPIMHIFFSKANHRFCSFLWGIGRQKP